MPFEQHKTPKAVVLVCCKGKSGARQGNLKNAQQTVEHRIFLEKYVKITHFRRSQRRRIELLSTLPIPTLSGKQVLVQVGQKNAFLNSD